LRQLPWLQLAKQRGEEVGDLFDCQRCMKKRDKQQRQLIGCGFESEPAEKLRRYVQPWDQAGREWHADEHDGEDGRRGKLHLPICAGYVCGLPEVVETSHAAGWKKDGELTQWCGGEMATPALREAITVLEIERSRADSWAADNPVKKS
jgi:hypothetical protein